MLTQPSTYQCRFCGELLRQTFVDLGLSPLCETYIDSAHLKDPELLYPLHSFVCEKCLLVQLPEHVTAKEIFEEYAYFSSYSDSWLAHAKGYVEAISKRPFPICRSRRSSRFLLPTVLCFSMSRNWPRTAVPCAYTAATRRTMNRGSRQTS